MVDVHTNVIGRDLDLDVIGKNGNDLYAGEGGLAALLGIRGADAHQAVHTGLSAEHAECVLALNRDGGPVDTDDFGGRAIVDRDLPTAAGAVLHVHLEQHEGPILGLQATLPGLDGQNRTAMVEFTGEPTGELHLIDGAREFGSGLGGLGDELSAVLLPHLLGELEGGAGVGQALARAIHKRHVTLHLGELGHVSASRIGIVPKTGGGARLLQFAHAAAGLIDVQICLDLGKARLEGVQIGGGHNAAALIGH